MKKIRGKRRHLRRAERWQQEVWPLALNSRSYTYRKIWLRPWSDLYFTQPLPTGIRRALLRGLLQTYSEWLQQLQAQPKPFYLAVWLFDQPLFRYSQVVAATEERIAYYETIFEVNASQTIPSDYQQLPELAQLTWQTCRDPDEGFRVWIGQVKT